MSELESGTFVWEREADGYIRVTGCVCIKIAGCRYFIDVLDKTTHDEAPKTIGQELDMIHRLIRWSVTNSFILGKTYTAGPEVSPK